MTYKFTNSAEKAIEIANDIALELGHNYICLLYTSPSPRDP